MRAGIVIGILGLAGVAGAAPPPPLYTIVRVGSAIDDGAVVGAKRAGLMCLPNGTIRWGEVASGTQMDQREVVQDAADDAGLAVAPLGTSADHAARLRAVVKDARFALCARHWLGGGRTALSGDATLTVEWRLEDPAGAPMRVHVATVTRHVDARQAAPLGAIYRAMLVDATRDAVAWLRAG